MERVVRFQDIDAAGIAFYPRVLEYFNDALLAFLDASGVDLPEVLRRRAWGAPVRHAEAHYFRPLAFGDRVEVALVRAHLDLSEVCIGYRVYCLRRSVVTCVGQTVHVFVDGNLERMAIPPAVRDALLRLPREGMA